MPPLKFKLSHGKLQTEPRYHMKGCFETKKS